VLTPSDQEQLDSNTIYASGHVSQLLSDEFFQQQLESKMQLTQVNTSCSRITGGNIESSSRQVYWCTNGSNGIGDAVSEHTSDDVSTDWGDDACNDRVLNRVNIESSHRDCFAGTITPLYTSSKVFCTILACMT
jgi:hypothetical protein